MPKAAQLSAECADAKNVRLGFAYTKELKNIIKKLGLNPGPLAPQTTSQATRICLLGNDLKLIDKKYVSN